MEEPLTRAIVTANVPNNFFKENEFCHHLVGKSGDFKYIISCLNRECCNQFIEELKKHEPLFAPPYYSFVLIEINDYHSIKTIQQKITFHTHGLIICKRTKCKSIKIKIPNLRCPLLPADTTLPEFLTSDVVRYLINKYGDANVN